LLSKAAETMAAPHTPIDRAGFWRQLRPLLGVALAGAAHGRWASVSVVACVMLSVLTLLAFLAMAAGYERQLQSRGQDNVALLLAREASAESASRLAADAVRRVERWLARQPGAPVSSAELALTVSLPRKAPAAGEPARANVQLRGLSAPGRTLRQGYRIVAGREVASGRQELMAGARLAGELVGLDIGSRVRLAGREWTVVGHFELAGAVFEGELWAELGAVQAAYGRANEFQSLRVGLGAPGEPGAHEAALDRLNTLLAAEPGPALSAVSERTFYARQAENTSRLITLLAWPLAVVLSVGTVAGCFTTMSMAVHSRRAGLRALHQLGYSGAAVATSVVAEALLLALAGALLAFGLAWWWFDGLAARGLGAGLTSLRYEWQLGAGGLLQALALAAAIAVAGSAGPAWRSLSLFRGAKA
jgi:putative ABC transport system permease protein